MSDLGALWFSFLRLSVGYESNLVSYWAEANLCVFPCLALGNSAVSSSPPVVGGRSLFSSVTRLGFAAGHDSPSLNIQETNGNHNMTNDSAGLTGLRNVETSSFANVISRAESISSLNAPKTNDLSKKGKKPTRVLLSTAGGRRY